MELGISHLPGPDHTGAVAVGTLDLLRHYPIARTIRPRLNRAHGVTDRLDAGGIQITRSAATLYGKGLTAARDDGPVAGVDPKRILILFTRIRLSIGARIAGGRALPLGIRCPGIDDLGVAGTRATPLPATVRQWYRAAGFTTRA